MAEQWFISDTHFGHANIINFKDNNDMRVRPFDSVEEMDELMVKRWNEVVRDGDRVYHLGDVAMNRKALPILSRLKGKKVLIKGNHDIFKLKDYTPYFEDIRAYKVFPKHKIICSHIPIHPSQMYRFNKNIHGHLHHNLVMNDPEEFDVDQESYPDVFYRNICVEHTDYYPVPFYKLLED